MSRLFHIEAVPVGPPTRNIDLQALDTEGTSRSSFYRDGPYTSTKPLVFRARCSPGALTDFPFASHAWPVMSVRAAAMFEEDAVTFPITVRHRDGTVDEASFVVCTARRLVDGLDMEASHTEPNPFHPTAPDEVRFPVVRTDVDWPRLLRLRHYPVRQYISEAARDALLALPVRGVRFTEVRST